MGVYTLMAGLLGITANSLAICVFCKTPKVMCDFIIICYHQRICVSAEESIQLSPHQPVCD